MIKNYNDAYAYLNQLHDKDLKKIMLCAFTTIRMSDELNSFESSDEFDMLAIVKFLEVFLSDKYILNAYLSSDWSGVQWWDDED